MNECSPEYIDKLIDNLINQSENNINDLQDYYINIEPTNELFLYLFQKLLSDQQPVKVAAAILIKNRIIQFPNSINIISIQSLCELIESSDSDFQYHLMQIIYEIVKSSFKLSTIPDLLHFIEENLSIYPISSAIIIRKMLRPPMRINIIDGIGERSDLNNILIGYINQILSSINDDSNRIFIHIIVSCAHRILNFSMIEPFEFWFNLINTKLLDSKNNEIAVPPFLNKDVAKLAVSLIELHGNSIPKDYLLHIFEFMIQCIKNGCQDECIAYCIRYFTRCIQNESIVEEISQILPELCLTIILDQFNLKKDETEQFSSDSHEFISKIYDISQLQFEIPRSASRCLLTTLTKLHPDISLAVLENITISSTSIFQSCLFISSLITELENKQDYINSALEAISQNCNDNPINWAGFYYLIYDTQSNIEIDENLLNFTINCIQSDIDTLSFFAIIALPNLLSNEISNMIISETAFNIIQRILQLQQKLPFDSIFSAMNNLIGYFQDILDNNSADLIERLTNIACSNPLEVFSHDDFILCFKFILERFEMNDKQEILIQSILKLSSLHSIEGIGERLGHLFVILLNNIIIDDQRLSYLSICIRKMFQRGDLPFNTTTEIFKNLCFKVLSDSMAEELSSVCRMILQHLDKYSNSTILFELLFVTFGCDNVVQEFIELLDAYPGYITADIYTSIINVYPNILDDEIILKIILQLSSPISFLYATKAIYERFSQNGEYFEKIRPLIQERLNECLELSASIESLIYNVQDLIEFYNHI